MKYLVRKSYVEVLGTTWLLSVTGVTRYDMSDYDIENARDEDGKLTRESVTRWVDTHSGDFSSVTDFHASIEDGEDTVEIGWTSEDHEFAYHDAMYGEDY